MAQARKMTDRELEYARSQLLLRQRRKISFVPYVIAAILYGSAAFILLFACFLFVENIWLQRPSRLLTAACFSIPSAIVVFSLALGVRSYITRKKNFLTFLNDFESDVQRDVVEEFIFEESPVVEVQTDTAFGSNYFVKIDEYRLMFICGGKSLLEDFNGKWPNSSFKLIRLPKSKVIIEFTISGELIPPIAIFKSSMNPDRYTFGDVIQANWGEVLGGKRPM